MSTPNPIEDAVKQAASQAASDKWTKIKAWFARFWYQFAIGFVAGWLWHKFIF